MPTKTPSAKEIYARASAESDTAISFDGDDDRGIIGSLISLSEESNENTSGRGVDSLYLLISVVLGTCIVGMLGCFVYSRIKKNSRKTKQNEEAPPACSSPQSPLPTESNTCTDAESIERHVLNNVLGQLKYHIEYDDAMKRKQKMKIKGKGENGRAAAQQADVTHEGAQCVLTIPIPGWCDDDAHKQHSKIKAAKDDSSSSDESSSGHEEQFMAVADVATSATDAVLQASNSFLQDVQDSFAHDEDGSVLSWLSVGMSKKQKMRALQLPSHAPSRRKLQLQRAYPAAHAKKKRKSSNETRPTSGMIRKPVIHELPSSRRLTTQAIGSRPRGAASTSRRTGTGSLPPPALKTARTWGSIDTRRPKVYIIGHEAAKKKEKVAAKKSHKSLLN